MKELKPMKEARSLRNKLSLEINGMSNAELLKYIEKKSKRIKNILASKSIKKKAS